MKIRERIIQKIVGIEDEEALLQLEKWLDAVSDVEEHFTEEEVNSVMEGYSQYKKGELLDEEEGNDKIGNGNLEERKITFIQEFLQIKNEETLSLLEGLLRKRKADLFERDLKPMSLEDFNKDIDKALEDSRENRIIRASDLKAKVQKWR